MIVPLIVLILAVLAAGFLAYGVHPFWAQFPHGFRMILLARRLQFPLTALVILLCVVLILMVISGKKRAWWLVGLGPILALLAHHFMLDPNSVFLVNQQPTFVSADLASFVSDDDWVVGIVEDGQATAYPYAALYPAPLVAQMRELEPMLLMWSPFANRALAVHVDRSIKPEELQVVSMPANTLLVYNSRIGQFINGVTGLTPGGEQPTGFGSEIPTIKTTWAQWRSMHPQTRVLVPPLQGAMAPTEPVLPAFPMPPSPESGSSGTVTLIESSPPCAIPDDAIGPDPINLANGDQRLLVLRDAASGLVHVYDRQVDVDLFPTFRPHRFAKFPQAVMIDSDSGGPWTIEGRALDGPLKDKRLKPMPVDDQVYLGVLRVWYPDIKILGEK
ncbi:MAG: DUF3179 domain-containing (seleno)protein [Tepidisphaeraceae bacterium]